MSQRSLVTVLCQEIIDKIIDYLEDDLKSLLSCAQTCREFIPRAHSYIFRSVTTAISPQLDDQSTGSWNKYRNPPNVLNVPKIRIETLHEIVQARPELPYTIRALTLETKADNEAWPSGDRKVFHIMSLLARSTELFPAISIFGDDSMYIDRTEVDDDSDDPYDRFPYHPEFIPRFWGPLVAPFITRLVLCDLDDVPIGILLTCPKLRFLRVDSVYINPEVTFGVQEGQPQLDGFEFYDCCDVNPIFGLANLDGPYLDPSHLRSLNVSPRQEEDDREYLPLMRAVGSSLENLVIDDLECCRKIQPSTPRCFK